MSSRLWRRCSLLIVVLGFYPKPALDALNPTVDSILQHVGVEDPPPTVAAEEGGS